MIRSPGIGVRIALCVAMTAELVACRDGNVPHANGARIEPPSSVATANTPASSAGVEIGEIRTATEYKQDPWLTAADLERGEILSLACAACHTFREGERHNIGPNLHGVFGRNAASLPDFAYSPALRASGLTWTPQTIEAWLEEPTRFVQGTTMAFTGFQSPTDRRDLIAYLLHATDRTGP
jgi:cytochrome c